MELRALLAMPELGLTLLCGDASLERQVRWVVPTDLPDPRRYLSGGELVLTGMLWRHDETDAEAFVGRLAAAGVAGLGAGDPERTGLPEELVAACRRHELPLFHVDSAVSFSTITETVVRRLSAHRSADVAALLGRHRQLIASGGGLDEVLALVSEELGMDCRILSATGRPLSGTAASPPLSPNERSQLARRVLDGGPLPRRIRPGRGRSFSVFGVGAGPPHCGWLLVVDDDHTRWPPQRRDAAEELIALVALELRHTMDRDPSEPDLIAALAEGVVDLGPQLTHAGLAGPGDYVVAVAASHAVDPGTGSRFVHAGSTGPGDRGPHSADTGSAGPGDRVAATASRSAAPGVPLAEALNHPASPDMGAAILAEVLAVAESVAWARRHDEVIAVARVGDEAAFLEHARAAAALLSRGLTGRRVAIGISEPVASAQALTGALSEARHAVRLADVAEPPVAVAGARELNSHVLLMATVPDEVRRAFRERVLGPVLDYDREHRSDLVSTLEHFLDCEGSWSRCAAELHLHVNTLRYRLERVERLTGRDLRRLTDRVDLFLALRVP